MGAGLRPYQKQAVEAVEDEWRGGVRSTLVCQATGTGKTVVMAKVAQDAVLSGGRVLLLAHRGELLEQAADKFRRFAGLDCDVEKAERTSVGSDAQVVVASVQTLCKDARLDRFGAGDFTHVFIDECHHAAARSYMKVLEHFPDAKVLGVTATADRADKKGLNGVFETIAFEYGMREAVGDGYLCPIVAKMVPLDIDIKGVRRSAGDYSAGDLGNALTPYLETIADEMEMECLGKRHTVVFLPTIETSVKFCRMLAERGFRAAEVNGKSEDRAEVIAAFERGELDVLCNAMLLTEGWDCPSVDCVVVLRPTQSRALYAQMVGRGTRLAPGKENLLLLDFLWQTERHSLCRPACLVSSTKDRADKVTEATKDGEVDLMEADEQAGRDVVREREEAMAARLEKLRRKRAKYVDPLLYASSTGMGDLFDYQPMMRWESERPTEKQLQTLDKAGIDTSAVKTRGMASKLIGTIVERTSAGLATARQVATLERNGWRKEAGYPPASELTFDEARQVLDWLSRNWWTPTRRLIPPRLREAAHA